VSEKLNRFIFQSRVAGRAVIRLRAYCGINRLNYRAAPVNESFRRADEGDEGEQRHDSLKSFQHYITCLFFFGVRLGLIAATGRSFRSWLRD
jgi:hypothetical protein